MPYLKECDKMARKTLKDFDNDYSAYADYLESAECANDDGYDTYVDVKGNIYTSDDWTKGHGHENVHNGYKRDKDDERSKGRNWKNPWLKYEKQLNLSEEEKQLLNVLYDYKQLMQKDKISETQIFKTKKLK